MKSDWCPLLILGALINIFFIWAALHDISRADESDYTLEYSVLVLTVPTLALICWKALQLSTPHGKLAWLAALAGILFLFDLAALSAWLNPKFAHDAAVGKAFLSAGLPLLSYAGYRLVRAAASEEPH